MYFKYIHNYYITGDPKPAMKAVVGCTHPIVGGGGRASTLFYSTEVDVEMR